MKKVIIFILALSVLSLYRCGSADKTGEKTSEEIKKVEPEKKSGFNHNANIAVKEQTADKLGFSAGIPNGWILEEGSVVNGNQCYVIKSGEKAVMYIDSENASKKATSYEDLYVIYNDTASYELLFNESNVDGSGFKRTGLIVKSKTTQDLVKAIEFEYYVSYSNGKFGYVRFMPGSDFNSSSVDSCYAVIKSMKQL